MARTLLRRWWIASGLLVAALLASELGPAWAWFVVIGYAAANLLGTMMLLRELRDQTSGPGGFSERWQTVIKVAFVLQLPVGLVVLVTGV